MWGKNWRTILILFCILLLGGVIFYRLFLIQITNHKRYQAQALGQQIGIGSLAGERGKIFCSSSYQTKGEKSDGEIKILATNRDSWTIAINPLKIEDKSELVKKLSEILKIEEQNLMDKLTKENYEGPIIIKKGVSNEEWEEIKKLNIEKLKGVFWYNIPERFYPQEEILAHVLGFVGGERVGQYGIEGYYEEILKGKMGFKEEKKGLEFLFAPLEEASLNGSDIYLTIDYNIQLYAENLLKKAKEKFDIDGGQIVVVKPESGKILALAHFPTFNPNEYFKEKKMEVFQNGAIQKLFEPGSILKPLTMAAALNEGKITPNTTYIDKGFVTFGSKTISNFNKKIYGEKTMTEVLENSINTGAVFAQQQIGNKKFFEYIEKFGLTQKTEIDLQGEVYSRNENLRKGPDINFATASFGQGIEVTPIQVVRAFCALANGGKLVKPYIVEKIVSNNEEYYIKPQISSPFLSEDTLKQLLSMMVSTVENGFNGVAKIPGYYIAGKTGTAQVPLLNGKGYDENKTIQSFIGFGPAFNPQFLIFVKLDNPKVPQSSLSAVPIFKELAQYIIDYWRIPPDY